MTDATLRRSIEDSHSLVLDNLALVTALAEDFRLSAWLVDMEWEDLIQEGVLGLVIASHKFAPDEFPEISFSEFARIWIKGSMSAAIKREARYVSHREQVGDLEEIVGVDGPFGSVPFPLNCKERPRAQRRNGRTVWTISEAHETPKGRSARHAI